MPCDLHQEHLNRRLKGMLRSLRANISPEAVVRAGKLLAVVDRICDEFEAQTATAAKDTGVHNPPSFLSKVVQVLNEENVYCSHNNIMPSSLLKRDALACLHRGLPLHPCHQHGQLYQSLVHIPLNNWADPSE